MIQTLAVYNCSICTNHNRRLECYDIDDDQILTVGLQHLQGRFDFVFSYKIGKLNVELL
jgi:hypothetical protein